MRPPAAEAPATHGWATLDASDPLAREWLLASGLGGSSSGTLSGAATRLAHGLLVVSGEHGRVTVLLRQFDARVQLPGQPPASLASRVTTAGVHPDSRALLDSFRLDPWPVWQWRIGAALIECALFVVQHHQALVASWRLIEGPELRVAVSPLLAARGPDARVTDDTVPTAATQVIPGRARIETRDGLPSLTLWHNGQFLPARLKVRELTSPRDGADTAEDLLVPGHVDGVVTPERPLIVVASCEDDLFRALAAEERLGMPPARTLAACVAALEEGERTRTTRWTRLTLEGGDFTARQAAAAHGGPHDRTARRSEALVAATDPIVLPAAFAVRDGLARRGTRLVLVRSLPHAREIPADALRAVPALVSLRAFDLAREIVRGYVEFLDEGLAPERFDLDDGTPHYGDPAVALWLVHAADLHVRRGADEEFLSQTLYPALESVLQFYRSGTRGGVRVDTDGLLMSGERGDKPAALNALWGHALVAMAQLARLVGRKENGAFYLAWARELQRRYHEAMWDAANGCLYESLGPDGAVSGVSPGQLLAVSLPPALLPPEPARQLVETIHRELFTPWGLRTHPGATRVDPAWLGPFATAWLRVHQRSPESQAQVREWLGGLMTLPLPVPGRIPTAFELHEGRPVPAPGADPMDVLASAELLRTWIEEVDLAVSPVSPVNS